MRFFILVGMKLKRNDHVANIRDIKFNFSIDTKEY